MKESDARSEGQIFVWLGGEMRPVEPEKLADQLAPMVAHVMVPRSDAEALAEVLEGYAENLDIEDDRWPYTGSREARIALAEYRAAYPKETP